MTSFISKLFGKKTSAHDPEPQRETPVSYEGVSIICAPEKIDGGQWRLSGIIAKTGDTGVMERYFLRVDSFPTREQAIDVTLAKGKQIIDEQGSRLFENGDLTGRI